MLPKKIPKKIEDSINLIEDIARNECKLDFFPSKFEIVNFETLMEVTSYTGMPQRYSHWKFGMTQRTLERQQGYGFSRIYELVINTDPLIAYLLDTNPFEIQKMVIAHVCGHGDFFKNNYLFSQTNRKMHEVMANNSEKIKFYQEQIGFEKVERFIEVCLSLENLIDQTAVVFDPRPLQEQKDLTTSDQNETGCSGGCKNKESCNKKEIKSKDEYKFEVPKPYLDSFINPDEFVKEMGEIEKNQEKQNKKFPNVPQRDILRFILKHGEGMKPWQKDILSMIHEEAMYFLPQRMTKIMNEGWAVFWHKEIMEKHGLAGEGLTHYAMVNSKVLRSAPGQLNPYEMGLMIWTDIKKRWDEGRHGPKYENETNLEKLNNWDTKENKGLEKIFEVRRNYDDIQFLRTFLTDELLEQEKFYQFELDKRDNWYKIKNRDTEKIRQKLITPLIYNSEPLMEVVDGNFANSRELLIKHTSYDDTILEPAKRNETIKNLYKVWGRRVHIKTKVKDQPILVTYDGKEVKIQNLNS